MNALIKGLGGFVLLWAVALAGVAGADETEQERMLRLEGLLRAQAEQLARIQAELAQVKRAQAAPAPAAVAPATGPVPTPAALAPATVPTTVSGPGGAYDPYGGPTLRAGAAGLADRFLQTNVRNTLPASGGGLGSNFRWGGYLTLEYIANSETNSFFDLHRFILDAQVQISDCIDLKTEIEFEHGGAADKFDGEVVIEHMDVVFRLSDQFSPKVGALLIPMGRYNKYHDDPFNDFTKRPWTGRYLVPTGFGQPGVGVEGVFNLGCERRLTYDVVLTHGYKDDFRASSGVRNARQFWKRDENEGKQVWGRVAYLTSDKRFDFFEAGLSATWAKYDVHEDNDLLGYALDLTMRKGPFEFRGEYVRMDYERNGSDPVDSVRGQDAFWAELAYHFFPKPMCACSNCFVQPTSHFTLAFRYQFMDLHDQHVGAAFNDDLTGYGVALNYRITENSVIRIDHTWLDARRESDQRELAVSFSTFF